jgi:hypothetical protein
MSRKAEKPEAQTPPPSAPAAQSPPTEAPTDAPRCDLCGAAMRETHCKLICDQCGYIRDCSDP